MTGAADGAGQPPSFWWYSYQSNSKIGEGKSSLDDLSKSDSTTNNNSDSKSNVDWPNVDPDEPVNDVGKVADFAGIYEIDLFNSTFTDLLKLDKQKDAVLPQGLDSDPGANAAAAVLNILIGGYGYGMDGLLHFLDTTDGHPEAVNVLICLNNRP